MASAKKIAMKLLVDKERSRVVYAEADKDFVDILFSFLTLPLSTIVKVLNKQSTLGCMDNLYESVEKLDIQYLQTEACKTMLLHPQSEAAVQCEDLKINIDDTRPRVVYACKKDDCCSKQTCWVSSAQNAQCIHCKDKMERVVIWPKNDVKLFVKEGVKYIISSNLHVEPATVMHILSLLQKMDMKDGSVLEERYMDISEEEILTLLKRLLVSEIPVTDLYFHHNDRTDDETRDVGSRKAAQVKTESKQETNTEGISIKLLINKHTNKILCAEVDDDFLNILFTFLTLPLGSLIKILNKNTGTGCVDNLYRSAEDLSFEYFESEQSKSILMSPKLGPFLGCFNNILKLDEITPRSESGAQGCLTCCWKNKRKACTAAKCDHIVGNSVMKELNPKSPQGGTEKGGGYAKGPGKFMVTNDLHVSPVSTSSIIQLGSSFDSVVERKVVAGEVQFTESSVHELLISIQLIKRK
ncbi:uncharacterized protein M6B38_113625 [Iris pallida]|uniref:Uncharacterized protein n=1 Tax=Iris pallida TaxID=29817 RepID=A0AAX6INX0_IRIPA|nr:uncharacterized protein M6B38_113625 [Iris pallida]